MRFAILRKRSSNLKPFVNIAAEPLDHCRIGNLSKEDLYAEDSFCDYFFAGKDNLGLMGGRAFGCPPPSLRTAKDGLTTTSKKVKRLY